MLERLSGGDAGSDCSFSVEQIQRACRQDIANITRARLLRLLQALSELDITVDIGGRWEFTHEFFMGALAELERNEAGRRTRIWIKWGRRAAIVVLAIPALGALQQGYDESRSRMLAERSRMLADYQTKLDKKQHGVDLASEAAASAERRAKDAEMRVAEGQVAVAQLVASREAESQKSEDDLEKAKRDSKNQVKWLAAKSQKDRDRVIGACATLPSSMIGRCQAKLLEAQAQRDLCIAGEAAVAAEAAVGEKAEAVEASAAAESAANDKD